MASRVRAESVDDEVRFAADLSAGTAEPDKVEVVLAKAAAAGARNVWPIVSSAENLRAEPKYFQAGRQTSPRSAGRDAGDRARAPHPRDQDQPDMREVSLIRLTNGPHTSRPRRVAESFEW